jgi:3D (Asp-Asp-Asp) domain-containing protein
MNLSGIFLRFLCSGFALLCVASCALPKYWDNPQARAASTEPGFDPGQWASGIFRAPSLPMIAERASEPMPGSMTSMREDRRLAKMPLACLPYAWVPKEDRDSVNITFTGIRTTAYNHTEADHIEYSNNSAAGTPLKYGVRSSAAADWSVFPLGTKFRIKGQPDRVYEIDDYGSALVGTGTIDIYKPTTSEMNRWGTRKVDIEIVEWGSYVESRKIMEPRSGFAHIKAMLANLPTAYARISASRMTPDTASSAPAMEDALGLSDSSQ